MSEQPQYEGDEVERVHRGEDNGVLVSPFWTKILGGLAVAGILAGAGAASATYLSVSNLQLKVGALTDRVSRLETARDGDSDKREVDLGKLDDRLDDLSRQVARVETQIVNLAEQVARNR